MPINVTFTDNGIHMDGEGSLSGEELYAATAEVYASTEMLLKSTYQIIDFTKVTFLEVSTAMVVKIAKLDSDAFALNSGLKTAVISNNDLVFAMSRMWEAYVGEANFQIHIFRDINSAYAWLGINLNDAVR